MTCSECTRLSTMIKIKTNPRERGWYIDALACHRKTAHGAWWQAYPWVVCVPTLPGKRNGRQN